MGNRKKDTNSICDETQSNEHPQQTSKEG